MKFNEYYQSIFQDQWPSLLEGLTSLTQKVSIDNKSEQKYELDAASLAPIQFLPTIEGKKILDMCAAPGGKSLALLNKAQGQIKLIASDLSMNRVSRLKKVLIEHTPEEWHKNFQVLCRDGNHFGLREKDSYDVVLLDAPCSSERHVLQSPKDLEDWSLKRIKGLKMRQHSLLCSALAAVQSEGFVIYSTCALIADENDGVIERLHESREGQFRVQEIDVAQLQKFEEQYDLKIQRTKFGYQILPWKNKKTGLAPGPIYWCLLQKI